MANVIRGIFFGVGLGIFLSGLSGLSGPVCAEEVAPPISPSQADSAVIPSPRAGQLVPGLKSGKIALLLSFLGTAVPAAAAAPFIWETSGTSLAHTAAIVGAGGILLGPSLGHFYAACPGRAFAGIGIRVLGAAGVVIGGLGGIAEGGASSEQDAVAVAGGILVAASVIADIVSAPNSARVHNDLVRQGLARISIMPSGGSRGVGIRANVSF